MRRSYAAVTMVMMMAGVVILSTGCAQEKKPEGQKVVQPTPPGQIRASHILISYKGTPVQNVTRSKEEADKLTQEILARIKAGESFERLAGNYSDCPSGNKGGDLGFFGKGTMVLAFEDAAFSLKPGETSGIVETKFGYHIIKRTQ